MGILMEIAVYLCFLIHVLLFEQFATLSPMTGQLTKEEIANLLEASAFGHLGYVDGKEATVLPINFAYKGNAIFIHTYEGKKLDAIRENPFVCLQVEKIHSPTSWKSVLVHGKARELSGKEESEAAQFVLERFKGLEAKHGLFASIRWGQDPSEKKGVVYLEIKIEHMSGRYAE